MNQAGTEEPIRKITISLLGAAAVAASIFLVRQQQRQLNPAEIVELDSPEEPAEETISLERLRELGI